MPTVFRHGEKAWVNNKKPTNVYGYEYDPPLHSIQYNLEQSIKKEITIRGHPKIIYCSPYLRCRQTAEIIQRYIPYVQIIIDPNLREFISHKHQSANIEISPDTQQYLQYLPLIEDVSTLRHRLSKVIEQPYFDQPDVWIITHGFCIVHLYDLIYKHKCTYPNEGDSVYIH